MRKLLFAVLFCFLPLFCFAENIPKPEGWVNDFAGVISPEYKEKINAIISELEQKTGSEIAVVTIESIVPYDEKEYARLLFDNWKIGKKGKDNGVLILLAVKERRWRIETGYGLEGILPDGLCGEIGRNYMVPYFKNGQYDYGLYQGVLGVVSVIKGESNLLVPATRNRSGSRPADTFLSILIRYFIFIFLLLALANWKIIIGLFIGIIALIAFNKLFYLFWIIIPFFSFASLLKLLLLKKTPLSRRGRMYGYWLGSGSGGFGGGSGFGGFGGGGGGGGGSGGGF